MLSEQTCLVVSRGDYSVFVCSAREGVSEMAFAGQQLMPLVASYKLMW